VSVRRLRLVGAACLLAAAVATFAAGTLRASAQTAARSVDAETATAQRLKAIREDKTQLAEFLRSMPKGGDLHVHLSGAVYAESYLRWASDAGLCLVVQTLALGRPPCDAAAGRPLASTAAEGSPLYDQVVDAWSMRNWNGARGGRDHFFATFARFNLATGRVGDMLAEVVSRAAAEHVAYIELMLATDGGAAGMRGTAAGWNADYRRMRDQLIQNGFSAVLAEARSRLDQAEARERDVLRCGASGAAPGCGVTVRYVSQVYRAGAPEQVFAQMFAAFELAAADPRVVSLNLVAPEDDPVAIRDFSQHMRMLEFFHARYPGVPITLHAGELAPGMVPPAALRSHIRDSIRTGHARRIGHGVDVMQERNPTALLRELASRRVLIEVGLSSNDLILGISGKAHPLAAYLRYGVPVAIATDDPGVARSSHTQEFVRAVQDQGLDYPTIKRLVRNSLDYAFADRPTRSRLLSTLDGDVAAFERQQSQAVNLER
jgi:adenosine deaminase